MPEAGDAYLKALERLAFGLVAITSMAIQEAASRGELTVQQWRVLVILGFEPDGARISALGRGIAASGPSTSRLIRRLERRGLVELDPDPADRRAIRVHLSPTGMALREQIVDRRRTLIREAIGEQDPSIEDTQAMVRVAAAFDRWI